MHSARHAPRLTPRWALALGALLMIGVVAPDALAAAATLPTQGVLRTPSGGPVPDGNYVMVLGLYESAAAAKPVWKELQNQVAVQGGIFTVTLGSSEVMDPTVLNSGKPLWLGVQIGGGDELPRVPLAWVAKAWFAAKAAGLACSGCIKAAMLAPNSVASSHLAFTYAGSATKGGPATFALKAASAESAKTATSATSAKSADFATAAATAKSADSAEVATSALKAKEATHATDADIAEKARALLCTGCVQAGHIADSLRASFVSSKGGKVAGRLEVTGGLDLHDTTLAGANMPVVDATAATCGAKQLGRLVLDAKSRTPYFCDGTRFRKLKACTGACQAPTVIACGQAITDDCGDVGACKGSGAYCANGGTCVKGVCELPGSKQDSAVKSCKELGKLNHKAGDGVYWIDPDGSAGSSAAFRTRCDMTTDGGGWTLIASTLIGMSSDTVWGVSKPYADLQTLHPAAATVRLVNMLPFATLTDFRFTCYTSGTATKFGIDWVFPVGKDGNKALLSDIYDDGRMTVYGGGKLTQSTGTVRLIGYDNKSSKADWGLGSKGSDSVYWSHEAWGQVDRWGGHCQDPGLPHHQSTLGGKGQYHIWVR